MELSFHTSTLHFLRCVVQEVHFQEETSDTIVPDSFPDIAAIADCYADVVLRGKDCREKSVTISGGIKGGIIYIPEAEKSTRHLDIYIPFSMRFEDNGLTEHSQIICSLRVRSVDARIINSRKAMLRVNIGCELSAYEPEMETIYQLESQDRHLQVKQANYQVELPVETTEKSFVISDTLDLTGNPPISQIYKLMCSLTQTDQKLVGNKAVFKGVLNCKVLYLSDSQTLHIYQQQFPYSQYCEFGTDYDDETVNTYPVITGYDLEFNDAADPSRAILNVHVLAQSVVSKREQLDVVEDAFSTMGMLRPEWKEYHLSGCLDRQNALLPIKANISDPLKSLVDVDVYWDYPVIQRQADSLRISIPAMIRVMGYDENGEIRSVNQREETVHEIMLEENSFCKANIGMVGEASSRLTMEGAEVRCSVNLQATCYSGSSIRTLCGGYVDTENSGENTRPSVIVRTIPHDTELWDLAKAYLTSEDSIRIANHLDTDIISGGTLVLLPIGSSEPVV